MCYNTIEELKSDRKSKAKSSTSIKQSNSNKKSLEKVDDLKYHMVSNPLNPERHKIEQELSSLY